MVEHRSPKPGVAGSTPATPANLGILGCFAVGRVKRDQGSGMAKTSPGEFIRQVRQETSKVTWPSRKELGISVVMVFIMVFIASMFFLLVDQILASIVRLVLGLGG